MACCDDDLPIEVRDGDRPAVIELTWADETTTRAFLGCPTANMAAEAAAHSVPWPITRRFIFGPGKTPPALVHER
jgi:hypothetical protein